MVIVGVANAFAPNYYVFTVLRFLTGILIPVSTPVIEFLLLVDLLVNVRHVVK